MFRTFIALFFLTLTANNQSFGQTTMHDHSTHLLAHNTGHAHHTNSALTPAVITGDHVMAKNDWMVTYSYMSMNMHGNRSGTDRVDLADIYAQGYTLAPKDMLMEMHMLSTMVGLTDDTTVMVMLPYVRKKMDIEAANGTQFSTEGEGFGDTTVTAFHDVSTQLSEYLGGQWIAGLGLSIPTGSIDKVDANAAGTFIQLPYRMQTGSGTWDLLPQLTWMQYEGKHGFGAQAKATIRLGENGANYRFGNEYVANAWYSHYLFADVAAHIRLEGRYNGNINGEDSRLNSALAPTNDPSLYKGTRVDTAVGLHWANIPLGWELMSDFAVPVLQNLKGPQMETDWSVLLRLRKTL